MVRFLAPQQPGMNGSSLGRPVVGWDGGMFHAPAGNTGINSGTTWGCHCENMGGGGGPVIVGVDAVGLVGVRVGDGGAGGGMVALGSRPEYSAR